MADITAAGVICYLQDGKDTLFLLLRSSKHGEWGPPKGHADEGETEIETALRELAEEAGIRRAHFLPGFREVLEYNVEKKGKKQLKQVIFFLHEMENPDIALSDEHTEAHFATIDEVEHMVPHDDIKALF